MPKKSKTPKNKKRKRSESDTGKHPKKRRKVKVDVQELIRWGDESLEQEQFQDAIECFLRALVEAASRGDAVLKIELCCRLGKSYYELKSFEEAIEFYEQAIAYGQAVEINSLKANIYGCIGNIYHEQKNYLKAIEFYIKTYEINPNKVSCDLSLTEVTDYISNVLKENKNKFDANEWINFGRFYHLMEKYDNADKCYINALALSKNSKKSRIADIHYYLGDAYAAQGKWGAALKYYQDTCNVERDDKEKARRLVKIGNMQMALKQYYEAIQSYINALESDKTNIDAWLMCGEVHAQLNEYTKALPCYDKALKYGPKEDTGFLCFCWNNKAQIYFQQGNHHEVINYCNKILEKDSKNVSVWLSKGNAFFNLGDNFSALRYCQEALRVAPFDARLHFLCWSLQGNVYNDSKHYDLAWKCYYEASKIASMGNNFESFNQGILPPSLLKKPSVVPTPPQSPPTAALRVVPSAGDGNCFFTSIEQSLSPEKRIGATKWRGVVADYLSKNKNEMAPYMLGNRSFEGYVKELRNESREWPEGIAIIACMEILNRPIVIINVDGNKINRIENLRDLDKFTGEPIFVSYSGGNHYDALIVEGNAKPREILEMLKENINKVKILPYRPSSSLSQTFFQQPPPQMGVPPQNFTL